MVIPGQIRRGGIGVALVIGFACSCVSSPDGAIRFEYGGRLREQFETFRNREFGAAEPRRDEYLLHRLQLRGTVHVDDRLSATLEFVNALAIEQDTPLAPIDEDSFDVLRGHLDWRPSGAEAAGLSVRIGRQELQLGRGRLVSVREGPNVRLAFDGLRLRVSEDGEAGRERGIRMETDAFAFAPVRPRIGAFDDRAAEREILTGLQHSILFGAQRPEPTLRLDAYYLARLLDDARIGGSSGDEARHTVGVRCAGDIGAWFIDCEAIGQFGRVGDDDIRAGALSLLAQRRVSTGIGELRPGLRLDWITGDDDPDDGRSGTFDALYPNNSYFNEAAALAPGNLRSVSPTLDWSPTSATRYSLGWDFAWRDAVADAVYAPPGVPAFPGGRSRASFIGHSITATLSHELDDGVTIDAAFTHFDVGPALSDDGGRDLDYFAAWINWRF